MQQSHGARYALLGVCLALMLPATAMAQEGTIAGTVRDEQGGAMPGVTVEASGPALIGVRSTVSDERGQYRITNLPVGTYVVAFTLSGFQRQQRENVVLTSGFTANVSPTLSVGSIQETVTVTADPPTVDVQNARQAITFTGDQLQELPASRNIIGLLALTPGTAPSISPARRMASAAAAWAPSAARRCRASAPGTSRAAQCWPRRASSGSTAWSSIRARVRPRASPAGRSPD